ncbi:MAG: hypothetical protein ACI9FG_001728 [Crocinitomicaceae bacterium]|jgi:hypothetical protein
MPVPRAAPTALGVTLATIILSLRFFRVRSVSPISLGPFVKLVPFAVEAVYRTSYWLLFPASSVSYWLFR